MEYPKTVDGIIEMVVKEKQNFCELVDQAEELEHESIGLGKAIDHLTGVSRKLHRLEGDEEIVNKYIVGVRFAIKELRLKRDKSIADLNSCNSAIELTSAEVEHLEDVQLEMECDL